MSASLLVGVVRVCACERGMSSIRCDAMMLREGKRFVRHCALKTEFRDMRLLAEERRRRSDDQTPSSGVVLLSLTPCSDLLSVCVVCGGRSRIRVCRWVVGRLASSPSVLAGRHGWSCSSRPPSLWHGSWSCGLQRSPVACAPVPVATVAALGAKRG